MMHAADFSALEGHSLEDYCRLYPVAGLPDHLLQRTGTDDVTERRQFSPPRQVSGHELQELLTRHKAWLDGDRDRRKRVDLRGLDLRGRDLRGAKLSHAMLTYSDLRGAILAEADLSHAEMVLVNLEGAVLPGANLDGVFLVNSNVANANFYRWNQEPNRTFIGKSTLRQAKLNGSDLSGASFASCDLSEADLSGCALRNAYLGVANLTRATIQGAVATNANLLLTNLNGADLQNSTLDGINLKAANLDQTNFKNVKGTFFLDDNSIRGSRFSTRATDPYSVLRRNYTGPMFFLTLFLTAMALLPYVLKAMAWSFTGSVEAKAHDYVHAQITALRNELPPDVYERASKLVEPSWRVQKPNFKESRVWKIVVGLEEEKPWIAVFVTVILVLYNALRGWLTFQMSGLRDAEERSHHSPARSEYEQLYACHSRFLRWFAYFAFALATFNVWNMLRATVYVPTM
jgi:uncharacterized protein YjbI with pentapeptide repeats